MHAIAPTIKPDDSGDQVANLQAALLFLLDRDVTLLFDPLNTLTADELKAIREALLVEASAKLFDKTTRALTFAFQQRQGLSPQLKGVVDQTTAEALNDHLRELGALDGDRTIAVKGHVLRQGTNGPTSDVRLRGFPPTFRQQQATDDESDPRQVFNDSTHIVFVADMCGDQINGIRFESFFGKQPRYQARSAQHA
jgi:hypothetical protein